MHTYTHRDKTREVNNLMWRKRKSQPKTSAFKDNYLVSSLWFTNISVFGNLYSLFLAIIVWFLASKGKKKKKIEEGKKTQSVISLCSFCSSITTQQILALFSLNIQFGSETKYNSKADSLFFKWGFKLSLTHLGWKKKCFLLLCSCYSDMSRSYTAYHSNLS